MKEENYNFHPINPLIGMIAGVIIALALKLMFGISNDTAYILLVVSLLGFTIILNQWMMEK